MSVYQENWFQSRSKKNSIFLHLSNYLWEIFYKSNYRGLFSVFPKPSSPKHSGEFDTQSRVCIYTDPGGNWTHDLRIRSPLLYRLSYKTRQEQAVGVWGQIGSAPVLGCCIRSSWCCGLAKVLHPSHVHSSVGLTWVFFRIHIHTLLRTTRTCT